MGENIEVKREEKIQHTDIRITAFLWCDEIALVKNDGTIEIINPNIDMDSIKRVSQSRDKNKIGQCLFYLVNRGKIPFRPLIMAYYNDRALVSPKEFTQKMNDLKDLINSRTS